MSRNGDDESTPLTRARREKADESAWGRLHGGTIAVGTLCGLALVLGSLAGNEIWPDALPWFLGIASAGGATLAGFVTGLLSARSVKDDALHGLVAGLFTTGTLALTLGSYAVAGTLPTELLSLPASVPDPAAPFVVLLGSLHAALAAIIGGRLAAMAD